MWNHPNVILMKKNQERIQGGQEQFKEVIVAKYSSFCQEANANKKIFILG